MPPSPNDLLDFWFGAPDAADRSYEQRRKLWFTKNPKTDERMRDRFLALYEQAARGDLDEWQGEPRSCLALVLLLDQIPRNIFRNTPKAFATDAKALEVSQGAIARGLDQALNPLERLFLYLPLEHSENLAHQQQCVDLMQKLAAIAPELRDPYDYALRHRDIIQRFGRFPHRNHILGRRSTSEEVEFLKQPGSSF
ncbi:DUF924 family protein [Thermoleptolyngbya sp. M55_K2018_002]|uniref:DUF924 family protein n=1 Tax=Thermoleptolyngbya sp. M55_K2018_002 TaxID=2747808 RepID=UPI001A0A7C14|nr:DUF924 family protein [Thermoleptolyngbya sp. M55_K2018_002]HIK40942.1 DUF924 domain-containing protein [Thermoleptolyngbya sp. M55_K2018_002]